MHCVQGHTPCNYILNLLGSSRQAHISEKIKNKKTQENAEIELHSLLGC